MINLFPTGSMSHQPNNLVFSEVKVVKLYTIGFTQKSAQQFFELLEKNNIQCLVDVRLHPDGHLSGFAKREDLRFFLKRLIDCDYRYIESLAPTEEIRKAYLSSKNWTLYEIAFNALMERRHIPDILDRTFFDEKVCCLLCSEPTPDHCHRRLIAERLQQAWNQVEIHHL